MTMSPSDESRSDIESSRGMKALLISLKVLEVLLIILCIGLLDDPATSSHIRIFVTQRTIGLCYATFGAFLIYAAVFLIMRLFGDLYPWKTSAMMSLLGGILFLTCTALLLRDWMYVKERNYWPPNAHRLDLVCATGFISLFVAIFFLIDLVLTVRVGMKSGD